MTLALCCMGILRYLAVLPFPATFCRRFKSLRGSSHHMISRVSAPALSGGKADSAGAKKKKSPASTKHNHSQAAGEVEKRRRGRDGKAEKATRRTREDGRTAKGDAQRGQARRDLGRVAVVHSREAHCHPSLHPSPLACVGRTYILRLLCRPADDCVCASERASACVCAARCFFCVRRPPR